MTKLLGAAATILIASIASVQAASVTIMTDEGGTNYVTEHGFDTDTYVRGDDLDGMIVSATYSDGTTEDLVWATQGYRLGGVSSSSMSLTFGTYEFLMETTKTLTNLRMEAHLGNAAFDILRFVDRAGNALEDTANTKIGFDYRTSGGDALDGEIKVTYSGAVYVDGYERQRDTFSIMDVDYTGLTGGGLFGTTAFRTDLDSIAVMGDLTPVPLPAGLPLLMAGIAGLGLVRRFQ